MWSRQAGGNGQLTRSLASQHGLSSLSTRAALLYRRRVSPVQPPIGKTFCPSYRSTFDRWTVRLSKHCATWSAKSQSAVQVGIAGQTDNARFAIQ